MANYSFQTILNSLETSTADEAMFASLRALALYARVDQKLLEMAVEEYIVFEGNRVPKREDIGKNFSEFARKNEEGQLLFNRNRLGEVRKFWNPMNPKNKIEIKIATGGEENSKAPKKDLVKKPVKLKPYEFPESSLPDLDRELPNSVQRYKMQEQANLSMPAVDKVLKLMSGVFSHVQMSEFIYRHKRVTYATPVGVELIKFLNECFQNTKKILKLEKEFTPSDALNRAVDKAQMQELLERLPEIDLQTGGGGYRGPGPGLEFGH